MLELLGRRITSKTRCSILHESFQHMAKIDETTFEVTVHKATAKHDLPIQIGFWVYSLAKMRMLAFYYDFLVKFFKKSKFELSQMDTNSLYFVVSGESVEKTLKSEQRCVLFTAGNVFSGSHLNTAMIVLTNTLQSKSQNDLGH